MQEMTHAASMARHVEQASAKIALGLPPDPPQPPSPEETFGNVLDVVHTGALRSAIAAHPEEERSRLISEAHDSVTKWIGASNGKVIVHGKVMVAHDLKAAQALAARIVNQEVEDHDQEKADEAEAAGLPAAGDEVPHGKQSDRSNGRGTSRVSNRPGDGGSSKAVAGQGSVDRGTPQAVPELPDSANGTSGDQPSPVGGIDPATGRVITHSTDDLDEAQDIATQAAPELEDKLQQVADSVPGVKVHGVRPTKDPDRAQRKVEADDKPVNTHSDLLAGRLTVDSPEAKDAAVDAIKNSAPVIDEEDSFEQGDPDYGFRSHDLQVALGDGKTSAEVQIVPQEVADVDEETHPTYEEGRDAEADGDTETADEAKAANREVHDAAMAKFNERNGTEDRSTKLRDILKQAGFDVTGEPVRIGGHAFLPIKEAGASE